MGKKLSFDLTDENAETLEAIKQEQRTPFGQTINSLNRAILQNSCCM